MQSVNTSIERDVASVDGAEDAVLETTWVSEVQVQLAVLAVLGDGDSWADGSDILIEDQGEAIWAISLEM